MSDITYNIGTNGDQEWYQHGQSHRDGDLPAVVHVDGGQGWYQHGQLHRGGDRPALIGADGDRWWCCRGQLHRDGDLPAVIDANGVQWWYKNGKPLTNAELEKIHKRVRERKWHTIAILAHARVPSGAKNKYLPRDMTRIILHFTGQMAYKRQLLKQMFVD